MRIIPEKIENFNLLKRKNDKISSPFFIKTLTRLQYTNINNFQQLFFKVPQDKYIE